MILDRYNVTIKNVHVTNFQKGIYLRSSSNSTIAGNTASLNYDEGIFLMESSNNTIIGNNASSNNHHGIYIHTSSNNVLFNNIFSNNTLLQANITSGDTNTWDNGYEGNYWGDYSERYPNATESDGSGIWDTPYIIDENNQDNYPLIPEFPSLILLPLLMTLTLLAGFVHRRRKSGKVHKP